MSVATETKVFSVICFDRVAGVLFGCSADDFFHFAKLYPFCGVTVNEILEGDMFTMTLTKPLNGNARHLRLALAVPLSSTFQPIIQGLQTCLVALLSCFRWFQHAAHTFVKISFFGAVSYLTFAVTPFCIVFAVIWAVYRRASFSWIGQDILCPTTIVPFFGDQPFWGKRVHARGVGRAPIPVDEFTLGRLVDAINYMLKPEVKRNAEELADAMKHEDGVAGAVAAFYKHYHPQTLDSETNHQPVAIVPRLGFSFLGCFGLSRSKSTTSR